MHFSLARLRGHRDGRRLTVHEVAERLHVADRVYEQIESGERETSAVLVQRVAQILGISETELYSEGATYEDDYADAVLQYATPMTDADIDRAAKAIHRVGHTATVLDASGEAS